MVQGASDWYSEPFRRGIQYMEQIARLLHVSMRNIAQSTKSPALIEAVINYRAFQNGVEVSEEQRASVIAAQSDAEFAQAEMDQGFPLLHAHALVAIWGALEVTIHDFLVALLLNDPKALRREAVSKTRISLAEFETLDREDRIELVLEELERSLKAEYKRGINRFEVLLGAFDLSGPVDDDVRTDLFELFHFRNVLVHRASVVDRRFVTACPWLKLSVGDHVVVEYARYMRLTTAVFKYLTTVVNRLNALGVGITSDGTKHSPIDD